MKTYAVISKELKSTMFVFEAKNEKDAKSKFYNWQNHHGYGYGEFHEMREATQKEVETKKMMYL